MKTQKRQVNLVVVSDVHLGTYGCRAKELLKYLRSIDPETLVLNGDIVDIWQFSKRYFPKSHLKVIKYLTSLMSEGKNIYYVTGNHDEMLRRFAGFKLGNFQMVNKLVLNLDGKKAWIFHGDVFDVTMKHSKWLAKLGSHGYAALILLNTFCNWVSEKLGKGRISLSKKIKNSVKGAIKHINNFEQTAANIAISKGYHFVVCGHIHQPQMREIEGKQGKSVVYLNSGDWIENLTALEYHEGTWQIYEYSDADFMDSRIEPDHLEHVDFSKASSNYEQLMAELIAEI